MFGLRHFPKRFGKQSVLCVSDLELEGVLGKMACESKTAERALVPLRQQVVSYIEEAEPEARHRGVALTHYAEFALDVCDQCCAILKRGDGLHEEVVPLVVSLKLHMVRVGLLDELFFKEEQHPSRQLLDRFVAACMGSVGKAHDPLFRALSNWVATISNLAHESETHLDALNRILAKDERQNLLVAKRVKCTIQGKLKADEAKDCSERALGDLLALYSVPEPLISVLKLWQNYLVIGYLDDQVQRSTWNARVDQLAEILAGFTRAAQHLQDRGLSVSCGIDWAEVERHRKRISFAANTVGVSPSVQKRLLETFDGTYKALSEDKKVIFRRVAVKEKFHCAPDFDMSLAYSSELERVEALQVGQWVKFSGPHQTECRAQLLAQIPEASSLVFVQRKGPKIFEKHYSDLAIGLEGGACVLIKGERLFSEALEAAISSVGGQCGRLSVAG